MKIPDKHEKAGPHLEWQKMMVHILCDLRGAYEEIPKDGKLVLESCCKSPLLHKWMVVVLPTEMI